MTSSLSDAELLARSVGEPAVFTGVYERHGLAVRRYAVRRVGDGTGDDIASEAFARAFRARGRYRVEHDSALPWLLGIANNVIADHRRLERRRLAALERLARETPASSSIPRQDWHRSSLRHFARCRMSSGTPCCWWSGAS
jgi:DNA-directed RNA polymerase specialized sigma24 family protein